MLNETAMKLIYEILYFDGLTIPNFTTDPFMFMKEIYDSNEKIQNSSMKLEIHSGWDDEKALYLIITDFIDTQTYRDQIEIILSLVAVEIKTSKYLLHKHDGLLNKFSCSLDFKTNIVDIFNKPTLQIPLPLNEFLTNYNRNYDWPILPYLKELLLNKEIQFIKYA